MLTSILTLHRHLFRPLFSSEPLLSLPAPYVPSNCCGLTMTTAVDEGPVVYRSVPPAGLGDAVLGIRFAPSIPNLAERRLHAFYTASDWPELAPFIAGGPDEKTIIGHPDDVLRLTASVRTGVVSASLMLRRLGNYPRQNGLVVALREIGRIERTLHTLDWLEQPALRRQATVALNKGESRNALARAVCFHRLGRLRDRTVEAQQHRASGLALVTTAIARWNTTRRLNRPPPQRNRVPGSPRLACYSARSMA